MTQVHKMRAFVAPKSKNGGNPAGVVLDADALTADEKRAIFEEANAGDIAFVSKPTTDEADVKIDFVTPEGELLLSGHAAMAALSLLKEEGVVTGDACSVEIANGHVLHVGFDGDKVFIEQEHPIYEEPAMEDMTGVMMALNIAPTEFKPNHMPMLVCATNRAMVIAVKDESVLKKIQPNQDQLKALSENMDIFGFYVYAEGGKDKDTDFTARMFAPRIGVEEESATGTLAGALACYVYDLHEAEQETFVIEQGYYMKPAQPSMLTVKLDTEDRKFFGPRVGGVCERIL